MQSTLEFTRVENEKIRKEFQEQIKKILYDYSKKVKDLEESNQILNIQKDDLEKNNIELKKKMLEMKIETETRIEENEKKFNETEKMKNDVIIKSLEKRMQALELAKEEILSKNQ